MRCVPGISGEKRVVASSNVTSDPVPRLTPWNWNVKTGPVYWTSAKLGSRSATSSRPDEITGGGDRLNGDAADFATLAGTTVRTAGSKRITTPAPRAVDPKVSTSTVTSIVPPTVVWPVAGRMRMNGPGVGVSVGVGGTVGVSVGV